MHISYMIDNSKLADDLWFNFSAVRFYRRKLRHKQIEEARLIAQLTRVFEDKERTQREQQFNITKLTKVNTLIYKLDIDR